MPRKRHHPHPTHQESPEERLLKDVLRTEECILERLDELSHPHTPTHITFQEITMTSPDPGSTLVFTGTLTPAGSAFPAGTSFAVVSSDPTVTPTVDETGLIVTVPLPETVTPGESLTISYTASGITPSPADSPTSISGTIVLTIGTPVVTPPATPTPTGISFEQSA
jgi:hypothetical protein